MPGAQVQDTGRTKRRVWLRITLAALLISLAGLAVVTLEFVSAAGLALQQSDEQAALSVRLRDLQGVMVAMLDAEAGERAYLLTGDTAWLAAYHDAVDRLPLLMKGLDTHGGPDHVDTDRAAAEARLAISDKLAELADGVRLQASGHHDEALAVLTSDRSRDDALRARKAVNDVLDAVRDARDAIGAQIAAGVSNIQRLLLLAVSSLFVFLLLALGQTMQTLGARSRFEAALASSEQRHRALIEDQSELVSLAREDGTLVYVNPAYARHYGRTPADLLGTDFHELIEEAEREAVRLQLSGVTRSGRERQGENRNVGLDGVERWVAWTHKRREEADGVLLHSVGRDVTERKRAERALRANQAFLHRTSEVAGIGGWEIDLRSGEVTWSEQVRRILEVDADHVPRQDDAVASYAEEGRETLRRAVADCIERGVAWDLELARFTATNRRIWVRTVASLELELGQPRRIVGALQDITERKLLEQRLADGERFLRQITDNLAVSIAYLDARSRYRFVNLAHCRRHARPREQIIGRTRAELVGSGDAVIERHMREALRGHPQQFEVEETLNGVTRRVESQLIPDVGEDGRVNGVYATGVDVTERVEVERQLRDLNQIAELNPDFILQASRHGVIEYMNPTLRRALGLATTGPLPELRLADLGTAETNDRYVGEVQPALRAHGSWRGESALRLAGDRVAPVSQLMIAHRGPQGQVERLSAVLRDISSEVAARNALQVQTATLQSVTEALPAMVAVVGLDGRYRFVNSAFERWAGLPRSDLLGRLVSDVIDPAEFTARSPWIARVLAGENVSFETSDPRRRMRDLAITYIPLRTDGVVDGYVGMAQDITQHRDETDRLLQLAQRDALTGLFNRAGLEDWLGARDHEVHAGTVALLYVDLDRFKPVNDTFGHLAGDRVLREIARRLQELVRPADAVARIGGDEFALALSGVRELAHAQAVAEKVIAAAAEPVEIDALTIRVGASVGIAWRVAHDGGAQGLLAHADEMLYKAKAQGRGSFA